MTARQARAKSVFEIDRARQQQRQKLKQLAECDEIVSSETVNAIGRVTDVVRAADDNAPSSDELDEDLEEQYEELNLYLDLPNDTYSLTAIRPQLPTCVRYGVRAGMTHINMPKFSPLSRGHQVIKILGTVATINPPVQKCRNSNATILACQRRFRQLMIILAIARSHVSEKKHDA